MEKDGPAERDFKEDLSALLEIVRSNGPLSAVEYVDTGKKCRSLPSRIYCRKAFGGASSGGIFALFAKNSA